MPWQHELHTLPLDGTLRDQVVVAMGVVHADCIERLLDVVGLVFDLGWSYS